MVKVGIIGYIEDVIDKGGFSILRIRQKYHPNDLYNITISKELKNDSNVRAGLVADCLCVLHGRYPYNAIICNLIFVGYDYKDLENKK